MEVLPSSAPASPPLSKQYAQRTAAITISTSSRASLLERRQSPGGLESIFFSGSAAPSSSPLSPLRRITSAHSLLHPRAPELTVHASPSVVISSATAAGVVRAPRKASSVSLPFVPLTPIMASPLLTPEASTDTREGSARLQVQLAMADDYLTHSGERAPPRWTSTPPTPPSKYSSPPSSSSPHARGLVARRTSRSGPRPASVAVIPSGPHPRPSSSSPTRAANSPSRTDHDPFVNLPRPRRRMSLPPNLSKPLPAVPGSSSLLSPTLDACLSRARARNGSPLRVSLEEDAGQALATKGSRKLFHLDGDENEDAEADSEEAEERRRQALEIAQRESVLEGVQREQEERESQERRETEERLRAGTRRYHALMELLTTEVGYLMDLRALVTVYLDQLPTLAIPGSAPLPISLSHNSTPNHSPLPSSARSPGLGLGRSLPSSRSSFFHAPPPYSPSASNADVGAHDDSLYSHPRPPESCPASPLQRPATKGKHVRRPILSKQDVQKVCRNAEELLKFHDRFVMELRAAVGSMGFGSAFEQAVGGGDEESGQAMERLDEAVDVIAEKFVSEAASFSIYEAFCPGHTEATNLIRNVQESFPVEWDKYEQRCSLLLSGSFDASPVEDSAAPAPPPPPSAFNSQKRKRRHSTSSLAMLDSAAFLPPAASMHVLASAVRSDPMERERRRQSSTSSAMTGQRPQSRLKFLDFLIKPVQRICKYPLLLDQLKMRRSRTASASTSGAHSLGSTSATGTEEGEHGAQTGMDCVESAGEAMRLVVGLVDRASEHRVHLVKSALIASRISFAQAHVPPVPPLPGVASFPTYPQRVPHLTPEFVSSLGPCLLAGALDVVHHPTALHTPSGTLRAKYLGAFLYMGGYILLVKVTKSGRVYEPRYWFSLAGFEVVDEEEDEASLPFSFHLCGHGHLLQLAASCHQEKVIWIAAIQEALSTSPQWIDEPLSSLQADKDEKSVQASPQTEEGPESGSALPSPLPIIQSLSELEKQGDNPISEANAQQSRCRMDVRLSRSHRLDSMTLAHRQESPSFSALNRRSSTVSVKAFFSPMTFEQPTRIVRPSAQLRQQIDQCLHDVFAENCLTARSQTLMREDELFQIRKRPNSSMVRSNSGLSITGAMGLAAKRRYDSVRVSRRKASIDGAVDVPSEMEGVKSLSTLSGRAKSMTRRRKKQLPSIVPTASNLANVESEVEMETPATPSPGAFLDSPLLRSQCSSTTSSNAGSALPSPVDAPLPLPLPDVPQDATVRQSDVLMVRGEDYRPKRTRSMVDNVRYFFQSRPESPTSSSGHSSSPTPPLVTQEPEMEAPPSAFMPWWRKTALRRRVQSSPEVPGEEPQQTIVASRSSEDNPSSFLVKMFPDRVKEEPANAARGDAGHAGTPSVPRRGTDTIPTRRRSLLMPSTFFREASSHPTPPASSPVTPISRKTLKSVLFFQRSNSFTPMDMGPDPDTRT